MRKIVIMAALALGIATPAMASPLASSQSAQAIVAASENLVAIEQVRHYRGHRVRVYRHYAPRYNYNPYPSYYRPQYRYRPYSYW